MGLIRDSFVIFKNWADAINALPEEYQLEAYKALVEFGVTGEIPMNLSAVVNAMLISFSVGMGNSICRYAASVENGKLGGRPPKNKNLNKPNETQQNLDKPRLTQSNLSEPTHNLNDNVNVNDNVNDKNKERVLKGGMGGKVANAPTPPLSPELKETKHKYGQFKNVLLTGQEYERLIAEPDGKEAIEFFSYHREMKGYKCRNDNLAIRKWAFEAVKEWEFDAVKKQWQKKQKNNKNKKPKEDLSYLFDSLDEIETGEEREA